MKIKSIEIKELYGLYDHKIEFNRNDKIDIVIGQNGIGKTTILKYTLIISFKTLVALLILKRTGE